MTESKNTAQVSALTEADIMDYLEKHPEMLMKHAALLEKIQVPHHTGQGMVSLIERQVEVLRDKNRLLDQRLRVLMQNAQQNEEITEKLHHYTLQLSAASSIEMLLQSAVTELMQQFDLAAVSIHIKPEYRNEKLQAETPIEPLSEKTFVALFDTIGKESCSCHDSLDDELLHALFGDAADKVKSCALLALHTPHRVGVIALGARERERYTPNMGTLILTRLGQQFSTALKRNYDFCAK